MTELSKAKQPALTIEELSRISAILSDPNTSKAERRKVEEILETRDMPEGVVEVFSELADESTDLDIE